jgi:capsular exopolysaccharide synthesis family protein
MVSEYLGLDRSVGLTTALVGAADVNELLQPWGDDNLYVLASGQIPPNPSELLGSAEMKSLILRLEDEFDTVVIDAPPLLPVTDAAVLAQHVGGVVVIIGSQRIKQQDLEKSLGSLDLVGAKVLGIILNRLPAKGPDAYAYGYYSHEQPTSKNSSRRQLAPVDNFAATDYGSVALSNSTDQGGLPVTREPGVFPRRKLQR